MTPSHTQRASDILTTVVARLNEQQDGQSFTHTTGFNELDYHLQGLQKGQLILLGARPSMGKTTFAYNLAETSLYRYKTVLIFSMDMTAQSVMMRMLSAFAEINQTRLRTGDMNTEEWGRFTSAVSYFNDRPLFIHEEGNMSVDKMQLIASHISEQQGDELGLIIVDYLQLIRMDSGRSKEDELDRVGRQLKQLAVSANCPVVVLSQLHRGVEARDNKRPLLYDLAHADITANHADTVLFIYRDKVYHPALNETHSAEKDIAEIIIAKQRQGALGTVPLVFESDYCRFKELTPEDYQ